MDYLKDTDNLNDLRYIFNGQKADITTVKNAFKELFTQKADEIFEANKNLFKQFNSIDGQRNIQDVDDFIDLINDNGLTINHPIFNFIKSE